MYVLKLSVILKRKIKMCWFFSYFIKYLKIWRYTYVISRHSGWKRMFIKLFWQYNLSFLQNSTHLYCFSSFYPQPILNQPPVPLPFKHGVSSVLYYVCNKCFTYKMWCCFNCIFCNKVILIWLTSLINTALKIVLPGQYDTGRCWK